MAILIDEKKRVLVQGITGREGRARTRLMREYGTNVVAGVTPNKGGQTVMSVPVFNTPQDAVDALGQIDISVVFVPAAGVKDAAISAIDYEAFECMAEHQFNLLFDEMEKRWPIESVRLMHRVGAVKVNEPSLWAEVVAPHRGEAFAACQFLIDEMKRVVPIWKKVVVIG